MVVVCDGDDGGDGGRAHVCVHGGGACHHLDLNLKLRTQNVTATHVIIFINSIPLAIYILDYTNEHGLTKCLPHIIIFTLRKINRD